MQKLYHKAYQVVTQTNSKQNTIPFSNSPNAKEPTLQTEQDVPSNSQQHKSLTTIKDEKQGNLYIHVATPNFHIWQHNRVTCTQNAHSVQIA